MDLASGYVFANTDPDANVEEVCEEDMEEGWSKSAPVLYAPSSSDEEEGGGEDGVALSAPVAAGAPPAPAPAAASFMPPPPPMAPPSASAPRRSGILDLFSLRGSRERAGEKEPSSRSEPPSSASAPADARRRKHVKFQFRSSAPRPQAASSADQKRAFRQQVDTNVVCVKLGSLADGVAIHSGDAVFCKGCAAVFNDKSRLEETEGSDGPVTLWRCEFCAHANEVDLVREECPTADSVDYILKPSAAVATSLDENNIVFCVDISGSMCVTTEVPGHQALRNQSMRRMHESLREHMDGSMQHFPGQARNVTYVSRLQSVQGAVDAQIQAMKKNHPHRHIGLVTFNNEVQIIGDGTREKITVAGDRLESRETLVDIATQSDLLQKPVAETSAALSKEVFGLEEGGQTALGPALLVAVAIAAKRPGGRVVLCTDGKANVGLGSLDVVGVEADAAAGLFYDEVAQFAKEKGVIVDVVSITGTECRLEHLGRVADVTGGSVERVDPLHLADNFQSMLEKPVIATKVSVKMMLHSGLCFRDENTDASTITRDVGAATADTEILFEFTLRPEFVKNIEKAAKAGEAKETATDATPAAQPDATTTAPAPADGAAGAESMDVSADGASAKSASAAAAAPAPAVPKDLPFQVQIRFTKPDGMECMRVITKAKPLTTDRRKCEETVDVALCSAHVAQKSARLAQEGKYDQARVNGYAWRNMLGKVATSSFSSNSQQEQYQAFDTHLAELDEAVHSAQRMEREQAMSFSSMSARAQSEFRSANRSDSQSRVMFKSKKATSNFFKK